MREASEVSLQWDLIYLGRKRLNHRDEDWVEGTETLVWPEYSYWTLSYLLTGSGAHKLLAQDPLSRMIPVDEYLPIMFDRHPQLKLKAAFHPRDLVGLSAEPLLVYPTHYTGEPGYFTDTDESEIINPGTNREEL
ncbi:Glycosyltransferase 25 family member [Lamellibrachia satsuma]|nr:Glycosyltransferase 25 family member [Lamellibrachia satsuma]